MNGTDKTKWDTLLNSPLEIQRWSLPLLSLAKVLKCFLCWWLNYTEAPQSLPLEQYIYIYTFEKYCPIGFPGGASGKEPTCQFRRCKRHGFHLGGEDPLGEGTATYSSILTWNIPWTEEPGRLKFTRVTKSWTRLKQLSTHAHMHSQINN